MISKQKEGRLISRKVYSFFMRSILTRISFSFPFYALFFCSMFSLIFVFVFGGFLSQIVTDLSKLTVGRLRPSFMAACKANLTGPGCQGYVTRDVCTGDLFEIKIARYETMWLLWSKTRDLPCQVPCYQRPLFPGIGPARLPAAHVTREKWALIAGNCQGTVCMYVRFEIK